MKVNFDRTFSLQLELNESELVDLLTELEYAKSECPNIDQLVSLHEGITKAIEHNKGFTMIETE